MKFNRIIILTLVLLLQTNIIFAELRTEKLSTVRENIVFPELTTTEKKILAEQAQIFFNDLYVNRYQKINMYGESPTFSGGHVDPIQAINAIVKNSDNMTTAELEVGIQKIFINQRDLHLNYIFPKPYSNYKSILPLTFSRVSGNDNFFEVRVNGIYSELMALSIGNQRVPEIGDIVVGYGDKTILEAVYDFKQTGQGANEYGGFSRAIGQMTFISQKIHELPKNNSVAITFISAKNGEKYTVNFDWLSQWKEEPIKQDELTSANLLVQNTNSSKTETISEDKYLSNDDIWQTEFNKFAIDNSLKTNSLFPNNPTNEPVIKWGLIENDKKLFGYLKITSFVPVNGTPFAIDEIIRIIETQFQNTTGLIIDVRNNGGGSIVFADKLSQLFIPGDARAIQARLLNTDLNRVIFNDSIFGSFSNPEWKEVINAVEGTSERYSAVAPFTTTAEANEIGQIYYKPVAVITNARSYSATDLFSCAMQDNEAAIIFGEDPQTGAGGANVIEHQLFERLVGAPFVKLPTDHAMRVSWRQSVRFGHHAGMLIEDHGCIADINVSLIPTDLYDGGRSQLDTITNKLISQESMYTSFVKSNKNNKNMYLSREAIEFNITVSNTEHVDLYINNKFVKRDSVYVYGDEQKLSIQLPDTLQSNASYSVALIGKDSGNTPLWNMKRKVTILDKKHTLTDSGIKINFSSPEVVNKLAIINNHTAPEDGWNLKGNFLAVGLDPVYKNEIDTDAVIFVDLTNRLSATLDFQLEGLTEQDYDFMTVYIVDSNGKKEYYRASGYMPNIVNRFDISDFAGMDNVSIHFRFVSDQMVDAPGVRISSININ